MTRPKVLLFVQSGDGRPKCWQWWPSFSDYELTVDIQHRRMEADRWWLVEAENAKAGRALLMAALNRAPLPLTGRILASGSRP